MKTSIVALTVLLAGVTAAAEVRPLGICVKRGASDFRVLNLAEVIARKMFAEIGVRIEWKHGERECKHPPADTILVLLKTNVPAFPNALAVTRPYQGGPIEVFYDRIANTIESRRQPTVLAHVFAHEIGHILQGVIRHSESGVMKAEWKDGDFDDMAWKTLPFLPEDVELILQGVEGRTLRVAQQH